MNVSAALWWTGFLSLIAWMVVSGPENWPAVVALTAYLLGSLMKEGELHEEAHSSTSTICPVCYTPPGWPSSDSNRGGEQ